MRILIIGNLGYIGPVLSKYLYQKNFVDIDGIDTCYFAHCLSVNDYYPDRFIKNQKVKDVREVNSFDLKGMIQ